MEGIQGPYLKGYRDFMSGVLGSPGLYVRHDLYMYSGTEHSTLPQGQLTVNFRGVANILGASYVTPYKIMGGDYAFAVRGAFSAIDADRALAVTRPFPTTLRASGELNALNDMVVTPVILGWHAGKFHWVFSTSVWLPIGNYNKNRLTNTGRNAWAFSPQLGVTYFDPNSGWETSVAAIYVTNAMNTETRYRSGDLVHVDFAVGKMLTSQFKLGLVGYYAQQVTNDSGPGATFGNRRMRVAGVGPGATFSFVVNGVPTVLVAKYYREFDAQNTTQGDAGTLSARFKF